MRTYNPGKLTKYGLLVCVVTESTLGYIGNLEIYSGEGKKLQETIVSVLEPYLDQNYHVYCKVVKYTLKGILVVVVKGT
jgi:hypothetical protein